jgi:hypothetical protein
VLQSAFRFGEGAHARLFVAGSILTTAPAGTTLSVEIVSGDRHLGSVRATMTGSGSATFQSVLRVDREAGRERVGTGGRRHRS